MEENEEELKNMFAKIIPDLASINITQQEINDFISNCNADNPEHIEAIMEDVE
jgi:hypothetical protein